MTLRVTPDQVRSSASRIRNQNERMRSIMTEMQSVVDQLPQEQWDANSGRDFNSRYREIRRSSEGALTTLMQHITNLENAAQEYDNVERAQQQKVSALNQANVFN
ncbi:MAG: WXG100 family type VII secretion target [Defluviitaleaceae bacterium]|nr:WXG100 family type VII secretion target [Defluviitaleaceae bacterium]